VTPTRPRLLLILAVLGAAVGFATVLLWDAVTGRTLPVPLTAALTLVVLALALFLWALAIRPRLLRKPDTRPLSPFVAARTAALAMAASRTGAIVAGFYLGTAIVFAMNFSTPIAAERFWYALGCVSAAVLVTLAALWLEYLCRLTDTNGDETASVPGDSDGDWVLPSTQSRRKPGAEPGS
jgi:ABC-type thiamin/hydroxymethylpyrimidine transport system permease subunit